MMNWSYRRRNNWVGATVLILVGVIGLAVNFNLITPALLDQLWKLWPAIPLALGISLFFRRDRFDGDGRRPDS